MLFTTMNIAITAAEMRAKILGKRQAVWAVRHGRYRRLHWMVAPVDGAEHNHHLRWRKSRYGA